MENQPTKPPKTLEKRPKLKKILSILLELVQIMVLYFIVDSAIDRVRVQKISMEPTLIKGDILFVNKLAYKLAEFQYGQIITFHYPLDPEMDYIKRVIGLPGDRVEIKDLQVWVNGRLLYEPYISALPEYQGVWEVPEGQLFVLGDNRNPSADSHVWGFVPVENVIGKVFMVYWPINRIKGLPTPDIFAADIE